MAASKEMALARHAGLEGVLIAKAPLKVIGSSFNYGLTLVQKGVAQFYL